MAGVRNCSSTHRRKGLGVVTRTRKTCRSCGKRKALGEFNKHVRQPDGHSSKCRDCTKASDGRYSKTKASRDRYRRYYKTQKSRDRDQRYRKSPKGHATNQRKKKRATENGKEVARSALRHAVRNDHIKKPTRCQECNKKRKLHGHHKDYSKPLDVDWLCSECHATCHDYGHAA